MTTSQLYSGEERVSYFGQTRPELWSLIPTEATSMLDIGCASGGLGQAIKKRQQVRYCGVDFDQLAVEQAQQVLDDAVQGDITLMDLPYPLASFDVLIFADILEHLADPLTTLKRWLPLLKPSGKVIVSLPNVQHYTVALPLVLSGRFDYADRGILDRTHLRLFSRSSARQLLIDSDLIVEREVPNLQPYFHVIKLIDFMTFRRLHGFFAQQWMFVARHAGAEV